MKVPRRARHAIETLGRNRRPRVALSDQLADAADLKKNPGGSLTLHLQKDSPGKDRESNWLPAPDGPIYTVMRLYWPKEEALKGSWKPPVLKRVE